MIRFNCPRESETVHVAWSGTWPDGCDDDLRDHVTGCRICGEVVQLAAALRDERQAAEREAQVPPSGTVWWRAQLRARREAARQAERPILLVHGIAIVAAVATAILVSWATLPPMGRLFRGLLTLLPSRAGMFSGVADLGLLAQPGILMVMAASLVLAPVAIYLAVSRD